MSSVEGIQTFGASTKKKESLSMTKSSNDTDELESRKYGDVLGKDDFLKILIMQLANQDPLNPMEDREFIAQLAQFSTLEQMTNMSVSMERLALMTEQTALMSFNQFIGKQVTWHKMIWSDEDNPLEDPEIIEGTGVVRTIQYKDGTVELVLDDGSILNPGNISDVHSGGVDSPLIQASYLIGKNVTWVEDGEKGDEEGEGEAETPTEKNGTVASVSIKDGVTWLHFADGKKVSADKVIKVSS